MEFEDQAGLSLRDAIKRYGDPDLYSDYANAVAQTPRRGLRGYVSTGDPAIDARLKSMARKTQTSRRNAELAWGALLRDFVVKFEESELVAEGWPETDVGRTRRMIGAEVWRITARTGDARWDWKKSILELCGTRWTGVLVYRVLKKPSEESEADIPRLHSRAEAERWYQGYVQECKERGINPSRAEDIKAGRDALGLSQRKVRELRNRFAPDHWTRPGRRRSK